MVLNPFGNIIIDIKNIEQALLATKYDNVSIMLYDEIPDEIRDMNISGPQFQLKIIEEIKTKIPNPLIVRIRIGNINELKILTKIGINYLYEKNIIPKIDSIKINKYNYSKINFINSSYTLSDILEHYNNGTRGIKITGNEINDTITTIQNIYNEMELLIDNKYNYAFMKHKMIKYNITYKLIDNMIETNKLPIPIYISNIKSKYDLELLLEKKHLLTIIDGIIIENDIFNYQNRENELNSIITLYRETI